MDAFAGEVVLLKENFQDMLNRIANVLKLMLFDGESKSTLKLVLNHHSQAFVILIFLITKKTNSFFLYHYPSNY